MFVNSNLTDTRLDLDGVHTQITSLSDAVQLSNKYVFDYSTGSKIRLAVEGGKLYISVADGAWVGQVTLTQVSS